MCEKKLDNSSDRFTVAVIGKSIPDMEMVTNRSRRIKSTVISSFRYTANFYEWIHSGMISIGMRVHTYM